MFEGATRLQIPQALHPGNTSPAKRPLPWQLRAGRTARRKASREINEEGQQGLH